MSHPTVAQLNSLRFVKDKSNDWTKTTKTRQGLQSKWEKHYPHETQPQGRWQGEIDDLVVYGEIPKEIDGTFYRIILDPYMPPDPRNGFVEGDGNICAIRIHDGKASLKMKYVETERYLLERQAGRRLFGVYRNPYTNDPSTRYANDSTGNTNIIYWGGNVLALAERGLPWAIHPDTLETHRYDPYAGQVKTKTFTAHPKVDPKTNELVCFGQEAKGLGTTDFVTFHITAEGEARDECWYKFPESRWIHDTWITENWIILSGMPFFYTGDEALKAGAQHWRFDPDRPQVMIVAPRRPSAPRHPDWKVGEFRQYEWDNGLVIHCGSAWEDKDGLLHFESPWTKWNVFAFWNPPDYKQPEPTGSYVRWTIDPSQPTHTRVTKMEEILPSSFNDFPVIDDRFLLSRQTKTFLTAHNVLTNETPRGFPAPNNIVKIDTEANELLVWDAGEGGHVSEPAFIPRSDDAPEGDGWVLFATTRTQAPRGEMVILDTSDFTQPVAIIQMPFAMRDQLHGNWVPNPNPGTKLPELSKPVKFVQPTGLGPLNHI
ncbi:isoeugenol monooxygenase [Fusarium oxysporum]|nr:isoeugenol monooxygenase [Fusarium oxysporum]